ncbi:hypothetical protein EVAR_75521_1 [Eumeta japonica]|uniref:Uncharacterized protein n=1 Tax=Eumeta variegata TaxID=151549 RepID=A0A4C1UJ86_EUMVA|nr:hypothetical protein EVAR_75521_1 [Eumeta japonica]
MEKRLIGGNGSDGGRGGSSELSLTGRNVTAEAVTLGLRSVRVSISPFKSARCRVEAKLNTVCLYHNKRLMRLLLMEIAAVHADASLTQVGQRQMSHVAERGGRLCLSVASSALSLALQALNGTPQSETKERGGSEFGIRRPDL